MPAITQITSQFQTIANCFIAFVFIMPIVVGGIFYVQKVFNDLAYLNPKINKEDL